MMEVLYLAPTTSEVAMTVTGLISGPRLVMCSSKTPVSTMRKKKVEIGLKQLRSLIPYCHMITTQCSGVFELSSHSYNVIELELYSLSITRSIDKHLPIRPVFESDIHYLYG